MFTSLASIHVLSIHLVCTCGVASVQPCRVDMRKLTAVSAFHDRSGVTRWPRRFRCKKGRCRSVGTKPGTASSEGDAPGKFPLVCLHGGPGAAHDYLESLQAMA